MRARYDYLPSPDPMNTQRAPKVEQRETLLLPDFLQVPSDLLSRRARGPAPPFVSEVEQFCRKNLSRPIGVKDMARVARLSRFHFSRQFSRARGLSPAQYLTRLRLDEAVRLLCLGATSVKEVSLQCGYPDPNYFCKVFRRSFGVSPGSLRVGYA
jgi:AraC-like DNA-binding protein